MSCAVGLLSRLYAVVSRGISPNVHPLRRNTTTVVLVRAQRDLNCGLIDFVPSDLLDSFHITPGSSPRTYHLFMNTFLIVVACFLP